MNHAECQLLHQSLLVDQAQDRCKPLEMVGTARMHTQRHTCRFESCVVLLQAVVMALENCFACESVS